MKGRTTSQGTAASATLFYYARRRAIAGAPEQGDHMIVNGKEEQIETPLSVNDLIERLDFTPERVAVELNGAIVPRVKRAETMLKGTDTVEIVTFVQGG